MLFTPYKTPEAPTWPPTLPSPGLLLQLNNKYCQLGSINKSEWGIDEWRLYAQFLEETGSNILDELIKIKNELTVTKGKASRRKIDSSVRKVCPRGLIDFMGSEKKQKRGRKPGSECRDIALKALEERTKKEAKGEKVTDGQVVEELLVGTGLSRWRAKSRIQSIKTEMSKIRNIKK